MKPILTSGKRKRAIARASLIPGKGKIRVNKMLVDNFTPEMARMRIMEPVLLAGDIANGLDINVTVRGGGQMGQAEAARLVIAKGILQFAKDKQLEQKFLAYDRHLLVSDVRRKETRKPNDSKARAKRQKSYR